MQTKTCPKCGRELPATTDYFYKRKNALDGLRGSCKECMKINNRKYYIENKEKILERTRKYYIENKEKIKLQNRKYYIENKELYKKWKLKNRDKVKEISKFYQQRRKSKMKKIQYSLSVKEWQQIKDFFNHCCAYCGKPSKRLTQEHFIPVSRNGEYTKHNIIPACLSCNSSKRDKPFEEWYPEQPFYSKEREWFIYEHFTKMAEENGGWGRSRTDLGTLTIIINEQQAI